MKVVSLLGGVRKGTRFNTRWEWQGLFIDPFFTTTNASTVHTANGLRCSLLLPCETIL